MRKLVVERGTWSSKKRSLQRVEKNVVRSREFAETSRKGELHISLLAYFLSSIQDEGDHCERQTWSSEKRSLQRVRENTVRGLEPRPESRV